MPTKEQAPVKAKKSTKGKFTQLQVIGLWVLIIGSSLFWGGVWVGTQATLNSISEREQVKAQAIEEYKSSLKN